MSDNKIDARRAAWRVKAKASYKKHNGKYQRAYHKKTYKPRPKYNTCMTNSHAKEFVNNCKLLIGKCALHELYNNGEQYICTQNNLVAFCWDHIDRTTKFATISQMIGQATKQQLEDEINKCWLLCANCHAIKSYINSDYLPVVKVLQKCNDLTLFDN